MGNEFNTKKATPSSIDSKTTNRRSGGILAQRSNPIARVAASGKAAGPLAVEGGIGPEALQGRNAGRPLNRGLLTELDGSPKEVVKECLRLIDPLSESLEKLMMDNESSHWSARKAELDELKQSKVPVTNSTTVIAVCGATGVGKSTLLNAILDYDLLPTSSMAYACTSVVTKISYHEQDTFRAQVILVELTEWKEELETFFENIHQEDGRLVKENDLEQDEIAWKTWSKIRALYPSIKLLPQLRDMTAQDLLGLDPTITVEFLSAAKVMEASTAEELNKEISRYIADSQGGLAIWPLVREVHCQCNAPALSTGVVLIDLPGSTETNMVRSEVVATYMNTADKLWIVTPIASAASAQALVNSSALKLQSHLADKFKDITFIATCADESEAEQSSKELGRGTYEAYLDLEREIKRLKADEIKLEREVAEANKRVLELGCPTASSAAAQTGRAQKENIAVQPPIGYMNRQGDRHTPGLKRRGSSSLWIPKRALKKQRDNRTLPGVPGNETHAATDSRSVLGSSEVRTADNVSHMMTASFEARKKQGELVNVKSSLVSGQRKLRSIWVHTRLKRAKQTLEQELILNVRRLHTCGTPACDDGCNMPEIDISIFACSSRDYANLKSAGTIEDESSIESLRATGIPELRRCCQRLGLLPNQQAAQDFLRTLKGIFDTYEMDLRALEVHPALHGGAGGNATLTRQATKSLAPTPTVVQPGEDIIAKDVKHLEVEKLILDLETEFRSLPLDDLKRRLYNGVTSSCDAALEKAYESALGVMQKVYEIGHSHLQSVLRAALKREEGKHVDGFKLHYDLLDSFFEVIAGSINDTINAGTLEPFSSRVRQIVDSLLDSDDVSGKFGDNKKAQEVLQACRSDAHIRIDTLVDTAIKRTLEEKGVWKRGSESCLGFKLAPAYRKAIETEGKGAFEKQKKIINKHLHGPEACKTFELAARRVISVTDKTIRVSVATGVQRDLDSLLEKIRADLNALWEDHHNASVTARTQASHVLSTAQERLKLCLQASDDYAAGFQPEGYSLNPRAYE